MKLGIDLGGTKIAAIVLDTDGVAVAKSRCSTPGKDGYRAVVRAVTQLVYDLEAKVGQSCTVGIGAPGTVCGQSGLVKNSNTACLNGEPMKDDIEAELGREIRMANDANCFTLAESTLGAAAGYETVFGVILGTGCGGGLCLGGRVHAGTHGIAGEWGHNVLISGGRPCYCGKDGCVESYLSGAGLTQAYQEAGGERPYGAAEIANAANGGDTIASAALDSYIEHFGQALAMVLNILDPDAVVLGGGLSNIARLYETGPGKVAAYMLNDSLQTPILQNRLGDTSGVYGAAMLWPDLT